MKIPPIIEAFRRTTFEQREEADRVALRAIGREWSMALPEDQRLIGCTDEEIRRYEEVYNYEIRAILNLIPEDERY